AGRLMLEAEDDPISFAYLVGIGRPEHDHPGNRAQADELLDRLMRGAVFAQADRIVREHMKRRKLHQCREPQRWPHIVAEDEKGRAECAQIAQHESVHRGPMACSRMPKCMLRPPGSPRSRLPAPSKVSLVLVEGARSPAPPSSQGTRLAIALRTLPEASRVAMPFSSAGKTGRSTSQSFGSSRDSCCAISAAASGCFWR